MSALVQVQVASLSRTHDKPLTETMLIKSTFIHAPVHAASELQFPQLKSFWRMVLSPVPSTVHYDVITNVKLEMYHPGMSNVSARGWRWRCMSLLVDDSLPMHMIDDII